MTLLLLTGPLLFLALLALVFMALHAASGPDEREAERMKAKAEQAAIRQEMHYEWVNGPVTRRRPNRHDRAHGRRGYVREGL